MIIYLARHGETTGDVEDRYGGDYDDHLTAKGKDQSAQLAEQLVDEGIGRLFASPRFRAQETAKVLGKKLGINPKSLPDFRERNGYGILTGMKKNVARQKHPRQVELVQNPLNTIEGAEEYSAFRQRVTSALEELAKLPEEKILVITHSGPIRVIFREILKLGEIDVADCAYAIIETDNDGYKLRAVNNLTIKKEFLD